MPKGGCSSVETISEEMGLQPGDCSSPKGNRISRQPEATPSDVVPVIVHSSKELSSRNCFNVLNSPERMLETIPTFRMPESQSSNDTSQDDALERFHEWVRTVRDPARNATEGSRRIVTTNRKATVEYEIAPLPDGRHAIRWSLCYESGNMSGHASPWSAHSNREACVDAFLAVAKRHFEAHIKRHKISESQQVARKQMIALLNGGLFGFVEPEPELRDS